MRLRTATAIILGLALGILPQTVDVRAQSVFERFSTREVTIPAGTQLPIILDTGVASNTSRVEQPVRAHLSRDVRLNDGVVLPAGSELYGSVTAVRRPGKVKGRSYIAMRFTTLVPEGI